MDLNETLLTTAAVSLLNSCSRKLANGSNTSVLERQKGNGVGGEGAGSGA